MLTINDSETTTTPEAAEFSLKYFRLQFRYCGSTKYLRLTGWSEESVLKEFQQRFPEAEPEHIECLGSV